MAESGRSFSPAELLAVQAHACRASQELDLAGKVVEICLPNATPVEFGERLFRIEPA